LSRRKITKLERLKHAKKRKKIQRSILFLAIVVLGVTFQLLNSRRVNLIVVNNNSKIEAQKEDDKIIAHEEENETINYEEELVSEVDQIPDTIQTSQSSLEEVKNEIQNYMNTHGLTEENFAMFYYQPNNNDFFTFNENKYFTAASTIKVPLAMIYYEKINAGELSLDSKLVYKASDYEAGTGKTSIKYKTGDEIPLSFLLDEMIINSDNTATQILKHGLGGDETYRTLISKYARRPLPDNFYDENVICAAFGYDIISYLYDNQNSFQHLIDNMKKSSNGGYLKKNIYCEVAHKYGSYEKNIHDFGIVYAKNNYLVGIFTVGRDDAEQMISEINQILLKINEK